MRSSRRELNEIPLHRAFERGKVTITMRRRQWDAFLQEAYNQGAVLLELDENEVPVRAYQKEGACRRGYPENLPIFRR